MKHGTAVLEKLDLTPAASRTLVPAAGASLSPRARRLAARLAEGEEMLGLVLEICMETGPEDTSRWTDLEAAYTVYAEQHKWLGLPRVVRALMRSSLPMREIVEMQVYYDSLIRSGGQAELRQLWRAARRAALRTAVRECRGRLAEGAMDDRTPGERRLAGQRRAAVRLLAIDELFIQAGNAVDAVSAMARRYKNPSAPDRQAQASWEQIVWETPQPYCLWAVKRVARVRGSGRAIGGRPRQTDAMGLPAVTGSRLHRTQVRLARAMRQLLAEPILGAALAEHLESRQP